MTGAEIKSEAFKHLATVGGVGAGGLVAWTLVRAIASRPDAVIATLNGFGAALPWFILALVAAWFVDRRLAEGMTLMSDNTKAQQSLADAVQVIAHRDDEWSREQELALGQLGRQQETLLQQQKQLLDSMGKVNLDFQKFVAGTFERRAKA
jgi:hypothetical protein